MTTPHLCFTHPHTFTRQIQLRVGRWAIHGWNHITKTSSGSAFGPYPAGTTSNQKPTGVPPGWDRHRKGSTNYSLIDTLEFPTSPEAGTPIYLEKILAIRTPESPTSPEAGTVKTGPPLGNCLLYTSDAADE